MLLGVVKVMQCANETTNQTRWEMPDKTPDRWYTKHRGTVRQTDLGCRKLEWVEKRVYGISDVFVWKVAKCGVPYFDYDEISG
jgi:hypothetical protein